MQKINLQRAYIAWVARDVILLIYAVITNFGWLWLDDHFFAAGYSMFFEEKF